MTMTMMSDDLCDFTFGWVLPSFLDLACMLKGGFTFFHAYMFVSMP